MKKSALWGGIIFVAILVALDQVIKHLVITHMELYQAIDVLPFLKLFYTQNTGIAFSMLASFHDWGLIALTIVVIIFVMMLWLKGDKNKQLANIGYLMVLGGAFGNLIDRVRFHYVVDYILVYAYGWSFAVFNAADAFITIGAVLIIINELFGSKLAKKA
ncbi:signal peptidase II [Bartonella sp. HY329]|uniref:signal peptidase II n=1 Tax=unclassified Bartonella TaxID=2645622 RepID=UPI0021C89749|nr:MULTISPECIES: signal peptidase II [unclassified Bartonella]UXM94818.1 signal peptidase II [Bartonella sp. HY329]UXN09141.1 signal peptidase II [Bartonella sp. HY328]